MKKNNQHKIPLMDGLLNLKKNRIVPFDVPGHKRGRANSELTMFLGKNCMEVDVNSMKSLDNLCHPVSIIKEAENLAAEAFKAKNAFFMINGTTSAVQAMILSVCQKGDKIILPRNVHISVINAIILTGSVPIYINPQLNTKLGIALGMSLNDIITVIKNNRDAKAIFINNPTYYGICSNIKLIIKIAHEYNMLVLVDEAHGTHFYFGKNLPLAAMHIDADMSAVSMHKSGGSLTQSSILLCSENINENYLRQIINLTQTTSGSYLLMSSLDISRKELYINGQKIFDNVVFLAQYARDEINKIGDYYAYSKEIINNDSIYDFDITKLSINTSGIGITGIEIYDILRDEYNIQIEFGDLNNILAYISVGDRHQDIERLLSALAEIRRRYKKIKSNIFQHQYINPIIKVTPQTAFYSKKESIALNKSINRICGEFIMCYPPGIPILAPGEKITEEILEYILYAQIKGCYLSGTEDISIQNINVLK